METAKTADTAVQEFRMGETLGLVRLEGTMNIISPHQSLVESKKQPDGTLLQITKRRAYKIGGAVMRLPEPSNNSIRSMIRVGAASLIARQIRSRDEKLGYQDTTVLFNGGGGAEGKEATTAESAAEDNTQKGPKKQRKATAASYPPSTLVRLQADAQDRNVVLSLLGASAMRGILPGKTIIGIPVLICQETVRAGHIPTDKLAVNMDDLMEAGIDGSAFIHIEQCTRADRIKQRPVFELLSDKGIDDLILHELQLQEKREAKGRKDNGEEAEPAAKSSATARQMIFSLEEIIPGTQYYHYCIIKNAKSVELGGFLASLQAFGSHPYLGGHSATGLGLTGINYTININGEAHGKLTVDRNGFKLDHPSETIAKAMSDFSDYLAQVTNENISVELK